MRRVSVTWMLLYGATRAGVGIHDIFFNAVAGFYLASFGLSNAVIGFLANERSFIGSFLQPVTGALSDRTRTPWGRRRPFMLLLLPVAAGFVIFSLGPPVEPVVAVFLLGPILLGMAVIAYEVLLPDNVVEQQRGLVNGVNRAMGFLAGIAFLLLAAQTWDDQPAIVFLSVAAALTLGAAITLATISEPPADDAGTAQVPPPESPPMQWRPSHYLRSVLQHRDASIYVASQCLYWLGIGGVTPFITRFGNQELGIPQSETFILLLAIMVSTLAGAIPAGWLGDRMGKKLLMSWGVGSFALFVLLGSQAQSVEQVVLLMVLTGFAQAIPTSLAYPLFTELVPEQRMGELSGLSSMVWSLSQPIGATLFGALADLTGTLRTVLFCGAIALAFSWLLLQRVGTTPGAERRPGLPG